jgi:hypothetical protein
MLALLLTTLMVAQQAPAPDAQQAPLAPAQAPLEPLSSGACLDAPRPVPRVLQPPISRQNEVVRIDRVVSTATMTPGEIIGFLYTLGDGTTWLGQRTSNYMSPAGAAAINQVLASTHLPGQKITEFPPQQRYGVATKYQQFFSVLLPPAAMTALQIQLEPCVLWPAGRPLPDPAM